MGRKKTRIDLLVYMNGNLVGKLSRTRSGETAFRYDPTWLGRQDPVPLSQSIPLREDAYQDERVLAFFDNLLPDNDRIRQRLAERAGTAGKSPFDLLAVIGRDCIGALQLLPEGAPAEELVGIEAHPLTNAEIAGILKNLSSSPLGLDLVRNFRISIAGAQEKTALLRWKDRWHRPAGATPTSHILKPPLGLLPNGIDLTGSVENEWLCLKVAHYFGLPVAKAEIEVFDEVNCLVVERFDRRWSGSGALLERIPQEDLCQALGVPSSRKYESDGGPGISRIMDFLNGSDQRDPDRTQFMRAQLVFFLLGAIDGNAKNFSAFLTGTGFRLTPLYDVMTVYPALQERQLEPKEARLAMCIGDQRHYRLRDIRRRHWEQTAKASGFPLSELGTLCDELAKKAASLDSFLGTLRPGLPDSLLEAVLEGVRDAVRRITP